jgi:hypothetical protein
VLYAPQGVRWVDDIMADVAQVAPYANRASCLILNMMGVL